MINNKDLIKKNMKKSWLWLMICSTVFTIILSVPINGFSGIELVAVEAAMVASGLYHINKIYKLNKELN